MAEFPTVKDIYPELEFVTSRSSGAGGQHVNKVSTRVTVRWRIPQSLIVTEEQKAILLKKFQSRLTTEGVLLLTSQTSRSQLKNKEDVLERLNQLLRLAFQPVKIRKATKPSKASQGKRLEGKRKHAEKKLLRKKL